MPRIGLGTWPLNDDQVELALMSAFELGYRLVDTAENYANETGVGEAVRASGLDRAELFVTTKFNKRWHGVELAEQALAGSLGRLGLDYVDLFLIHWPNPRQDRYVAAWQGMLKLREQGLARAIGVSNFKRSHLQRLIDETGQGPEVNQIEMSPMLARADLRAFHAEHDIVTEAYSPLARGNELLDGQTVGRIADVHGRTPAQVVLRWHVQVGAVPVPKSANRRRQAENIDVFDFALDDDEMAAMAALDRGERGAADSDSYGH